MITETDDQYSVHCVIVSLSAAKAAELIAVLLCDIDSNGTKSVGDPDLLLEERTFCGPYSKMPPVPDEAGCY